VNLQFAQMPDDIIGEHASVNDEANVLILESFDEVPERFHILDGTEEHVHSDRNPCVHRKCYDNGDLPLP